VHHDKTLAVKLRSDHVQFLGSCLFRSCLAELRLIAGGAPTGEILSYIGDFDVSVKLIQPTLAASFHSMKP